jgi:hypothetical protein
MKLWLLSAAALSSLAVPASAATVYGIDGDQLVSFDSVTPGSYATSVAFSGLGMASLTGLDFRPATGGLYGLGSDNVLYTINVTTGAATAVGAAFTQLEGQSFGFDFNPTIDRIRVVSNTNNNYVINPANGALTAATPVFYAAGDVNAGRNPDIVSVAYTPSTFGAPGTSTQLYAIDARNDVLVKQANSAGTLTTVGSLGINLAYNGGFDIGADGTGLVYSGTEIYNINLNTGALSLIGSTQSALFGIAIAAPAVPEASTWAMMIVGFGLVGGAARRRAARVSYAI